MPVNRNKPDTWKKDIARSVDMYNRWFLDFAPDTYRATRVRTTTDVETTLRDTSNLTDITVEMLRAKPSTLPTLRMSTCPPLAVDRLIGLAHVPPNLVKTMEKSGKLPARMPKWEVNNALKEIATVIHKMVDPDIFVWLGRARPPSQPEVYRAATIVADRLCGALANPIIRNSQEARQLNALRKWLEGRGYQYLDPNEGTKYDDLAPGTFAFRLNVQAKQERTNRTVNIPVDAVIMPKAAKRRDLPIMVEAKSAGDFANVNKRRKEEATKMSQLRRTFGQKVQFILFLCGYFDSGYLGYEAAEGIDWVWEHRIGDFAKLGL